MKSLFTLPETPVDQYSLEWYDVDVSPVWCYIDHKKVVYHVDTPWGKISDVKGGAPLTDQWQIFKNGHFCSRFTGWDFLAKDSSMWENCFLTKEQAVNEATRQLNGYISSAKKKIVCIEELLLELKGGQ